MKILKLFEEFSQDTLKINNSKYDSIASYSKTDYSKVAWTEESQQKNFDYISKFLKNKTILDFGCGLGDLISYLKNNNIPFKYYFGVDINPTFINTAKEKYPEYNFNKINDVNDIEGNYDVVCAIGTFTYYITRDEFIKTINKLYELSNEQVILILLHDENKIDNDDFWNNKCNCYNKKIIDGLFPTFDIEYDYFSVKKSNYNAIVIKINKNND